MNNRLLPLRRAVTCAAAALALGGCFGGRIPALELYRLSPPASQTSGSGEGGPLPGGLAVARYQTPGVYGERGILYRVEETRYGVYPNREWALPLGEMLALVAQQALVENPLTANRAASDGSGRAGAAYMWRGVVREFEEVVRGREIFAVVSLEASLVRAEDNVVVWTGSRRMERQVERPTMPEIVRTLSELAWESSRAMVAEAKTAVMRPTGMQAGPGN